MENKNKKKLMIGIAAVIVVIVAAIVVVLCVTKVGKNQKSNAQETVVVTDKNGKEIKKTKKEIAKEKAAEKKKEKAWDGVEIKEEETKSKNGKQVIYKRNKKGEIVTNKKGEKVTRKPAYAGEDEGWSPIVTPDDLKKNK